MNVAKPQRTQRFLPQKRKTHEKEAPYPDTPKRGHQTQRIHAAEHVQKAQNKSGESFICAFYTVRRPENFSRGSFVSRFQESGAVFAFLVVEVWASQSPALR
jgi:hypothetical protein